MPISFHLWNLLVLEQLRSVSSSHIPGRRSIVPIHYGDMKGPAAQNSHFAAA